MERITYKVAKEEILFSMRLLMDGIFEGTVCEEDGALVIAFANGQSFQINVEEL